MPRKSLPSSFKSLKVFDDIEITKTTEEEVFGYYKNYCDTFENKADYFVSALEKAGEEFFEGNPFLNRNVNAWRNKRVSCEWKDNSMDWLVDLGEDKVEEYQKLILLMTDLRKIDKELNWSASVPEFYEWIASAERFNALMRDKVEEIKLYEQIRFAEAKKSYEAKDKEYITKYQNERTHTLTHYSNEYYEELFKKDPDSVKFYNGVIPTHYLTCELCIEAERRVQIEKQFQLELEEAQKKRDEDYTRHLLEVQAEERRKWLENRREYNCELCNYKTYSVSQYKNHCDSKDHKTKKNNAEWYCETCKFKARSTNEADYHFKSKKHLKAIGDIVEPDCYECVPCGYKTEIKCNYETHLKSKKHLSLVSQQVSVQSLQVSCPDTLCV